MSRRIRIAIVGGGIGGLTLGGRSATNAASKRTYTSKRRNWPRSARRLRSPPTPPGSYAGSACSTRSRLSRPSQASSSTAIGGTAAASRRIRFVEHAYQGMCGRLLGIHRADLQRILSGALGGAGLHLDHRLTEIRELGGATGLSFANGRTVEADLVVGADGVRSLVRRFITGGDDTVYSGTSAFRGIVPVRRNCRRCPTRGDPVLDGAECPPTALCDRRRERVRQFLRRHRVPEGLAARRQVARSN